MRKSQSVTRKLKPDLVYNSVVVARIINRAMRNGKKGASTTQIYNCLEMIKKETKQDPVIYLEQALENIKPKVEVRPRRIGGAVYQVPTPVRPHRQLSLSIRWLVESARSLPSKQFHTFADKLHAELKNAFANSGASVTKRNEIERMAEANKAFSHLRW